MSTQGLSTPRVAVVGAGHLGTYHLQKLSLLQAEGHCELVSAVDIDPEVRHKTHERFRIPVHGKLTDLPRGLQGVIIATPSTTHASLGTQALEHGWDVLMEKPLAADLSGAETLVQLAGQQERILQVGHIERFNPAVRAALAVADRPRYVVAERLGPFTGRSTDVDVFLDVMIHDLDLVTHLIPAEVTEIRAVGVPVLTPAVDMAAVRLAFSDGSVAQLSAGRSSLEPSRKLRLFTLERYLSIDCATREIKSVRRLPPLNGDNWPQITAEPIEVPEGDSLYAQDLAFVRSIASRAPPEIGGAEGLRALRLALQIRDELRIPLPNL